MIFATLYPLSLFALLAPFTDSLGLIMLLVICPIGTVVLRYSVRYLDGDSGQGRFITWIAVTLAGAAAMVSTNRLDLFFLFWISVSLSLHKLLTFYSERPKAIECARSKFIISRIGDIALITGIWLTYSLCKNLDFQTIFSTITAQPLHYQTSLELIAICFAIGALTKSAQLPFHHWLPQSLETPTPVSALMHAGIINAGGFLLIRLSFLFEHVVYANVILAVMGSVTAVFGMSAMITQTSIKKRLAYSTIGQMGFMIMQCGLGLYTLALLHIIAHGFYKAYAFLRAGSAMEQAHEQRFFPKRFRASSSAAIIAAVSVAIAIITLLINTSSVNPLIPIYCIWGLVTLHTFMQSITVEKDRLYSIFSALGVVFSMIAVYTCSTVILDSFLSKSVSGSWLLLHASISHFTILTVSSIFILGFVLQTLVARITKTKAGLLIFVALHNGLYVGARKLLKNKIIPAQIKNRGECDLNAITKSLQIAKNATDQVAPLWGLQNFVAVNPFWGFRQHSFIDTAMLIEKYGHTSITQSLPNSSSFIKTFSEFLDEKNKSSLSSVIEDEISKFCSLYFDRGQAMWPFPLKEDSLYEAWKNFAYIDKTLRSKGIQDNFFLSSLPHSYTELFNLFQQSLRQEDPKLVEALFSRAIFSIKGWASYIQHLVFEDAKIGKHNSLCLELLAIRLSYEIMLLSVDDFQKYIAEYTLATKNALGFRNDSHVKAYETTEALELNFITSLESTFKNQTTIDRTRPKLQAVFCIDVRSEGYRRLLEQQSDQIETYGFAGFFGLTLRHQMFGTESEINQCPVLLQNSFTVSEKPIESTSKKALVELRFGRHLSGLVKILRQSISSGFNFVESFGIFYFIKMMKDSSNLINKRNSLYLQTDISIDLTFEDQVQSAQSILKNMGLNYPYAPLVLLCGHESQTNNNPFNAGLDCGACGGHSGRVNVLTAAKILNNAQVRSELVKNGISLPTDTVFIPAIHNTTTDEVSILSFESQDSKDEKIIQLTKWLSQTSLLSRKNRLPSLTQDLNSTDRICFKRSNDWSEVRPEWGLARNAGFVAARRSRTRAANLENRCFLHEYDFEKDSDLSILELIMTAPMVVASWINLQYFASTIAPECFGAGNKVIHNVVGQLGVILGNGGDLQIGLPMQSVHTGNASFHEPLRLQVILEAPKEAIEKIIFKHELLQMLIKNNWIKVFSLDRNSAFLQRITFLLTEDYDYIAV